MTAAIYGHHYTTTTPLDDAGLRLSHWYTEGEPHPAIHLSIEGAGFRYFAFLNIDQLHALSAFLEAHAKQIAEHDADWPPVK